VQTTLARCYRREPHKFLQTAVSSVEDQLLFVRIYDALGRQGIRHDPGFFFFSHLSPEKMIKN
jgi:hypothetical protein